MSRTKNAKAAQAAPKKGRRKVAASEAGALPAPVKSNGFAVGDRLFHPQFGVGTISAIDDPKLSINFDMSGDKQIIDSYVKHHKS